MSLEAHGLECVFGESSVLGPLDLSVAPGEVLGITGPGGSGKSALLHAIAGLDPGALGAYRIQGVEVTEAERRRTLATLIPRRIPALPSTVGALLRSASRWHGRSCVEDRADEGASLAGMTPRERHEAWRSIAASLAPPVVLLDCPEEAAGSDGRAALLAWIAAQRARGAALVLATQDEDLLARTASRLIILFEGSVHAEGPVSEVIPAACEAARRKPVA